MNESRQCVLSGCVYEVCCRFVAVCVAVCIAVCVAVCVAVRVAVCVAVFVAVCVAGMNDCMNE